MVDKVVAVPQVAITEEIGECNDDDMETVEVGLRRWLQLDWRQTGGLDQSGEELVSW